MDGKTEMSEIMKQVKLWGLTDEEIVRVAALVKGGNDVERAAGLVCLERISKSLNAANSPPQKKGPP